MDALIRADRAEGEHELPVARQAERRARGQAIGSLLALEKARVAVMDELDPDVGRQTLPCDPRGSLRVDDDGVGGGVASPERPVVPANALVGAHVVERHHDPRAPPDQRPQQRVEAGRDHALHVDDAGAHPSHALAQRLHVTEVAGAGGEAAVDLECRGQVRQLPLAVGQERDLDTTTRERGAQVPGVVGDATPPAGLDHEDLHRVRTAGAEPSARSSRTHATCFARRLAARRRSTGGYLTTSAAIRVSVLAATAARRIAAEPRR